MSNRTPSGLPENSAQRKRMPMAAGLLDYFPAALAEVALVSFDGNEQHNPGQELHWARGKSMDHADCIMRHLADRGSLDERGMRHSAKLAWRALALLQQELEDEGAPLSRASRVAQPELTGTIILRGPFCQSDSVAFADALKQGG